MQIERDRPWWRPDPRDEGVWYLSVRVQPGASRTEVVGEYGEQLRVRLAAPPVDGKANAALEQYVARELELPRAAVTVLRGHTSRSKVLRVDAGRLA
ncbi:MAG TPA: DUF167 domain-containing protein [Nocardioides sp.]|nr:DUF167 domain-containing protein [Nocardioides sp.]